MKFKTLEDWTVVFFIMILLVSSISAIKYFDSQEVFEAKILQQNQNGEFSIDLQIENKLNENLNFEIETIYKRGNLVVNSENLKCKTTCNINLEIDKIFFDKYNIIIKTFYKGRGYKKKISFKFNKQLPSFSATVPNKLFWDYKDLIIPIKFISTNKDKTKISNYVLDIYPTNRPEIKSTFTYQCAGTCRDDFIISRAILFGEYSINIYSNIDVLKLNFTVIPKDINLSKMIIPENKTQIINQTLPLQNQTLKQNKTKSLEESLGYTKIEYDKSDIEESETVENCIIDDSLDDESKELREEEISLAFCKFDYELNDIDENFEIKSIPSTIEMGEEFEFEITIPVGTDLNDSNFNLPEGFEIVAEKQINDSIKQPSKINAINSKFNAQLNQVTTPIAKSYLVKGTVRSLDDTVQIFENKGWLKKDLELNIKKSEELLEFEKVIKVDVNKIKKNQTSNKSDLTIQKNTSQIEFEEIELESIDKIEIIKKSDLTDYNPTIRNNLETDIINVLADDFSKATITLKKTNNELITTILTCDYFGESQCTSGWEDSGYKITQNNTHVWFDVTHFSAYAGTGEGYIFNVDFENYKVTKIHKNQVKKINVSVTCDPSGNCGTINVSLRSLSSSTTTFENFESNYGSTTRDTGTCTWVRNKGRTTSASTGPGGRGNGFDHTIGDTTGWYVYVETSNNVCTTTDKKAILTGTSFQAGSLSSTLSFWYHMYGSHMGNLYVDIYNGASWDLNVWSVLGQQHTADQVYTQAVIDLSAYSGIINYRFRFNGVKGYYSDIALDDIYVESMGESLTNTTSIPFKVEGPMKKQVSLLQGETKIVEFEINATGNQGDILEMYAFGISSTDSTVKSESTIKFLSIPETVPPSGSKSSPTHTSISVTKSITFNAIVSDNVALSKATINIWNSKGDLVGSEIKYVSGTSDSVNFNYSFTNNGAYTWNIFVEDLNGNTAWLGSNWTINLDFPGIGLNFVNLPDNFQIIKDTTKTITVDVSCTNANCGLTDVTLTTYVYSPPIFNDFEPGNLGIWSNVDGDDFDWKEIRADFTRSTIEETGIGTDHTTSSASGHFIYYETSGGDATIDGPTYLESESFTSSGLVTLDFWYNMHAPQDPTLAVEYYDGSVWTEIWTITGDQGTSWINKKLVVNHLGDMQFRFVATKHGHNNDWRQDISLDDITITVDSYNFINNISTIPLYVMDSSIQQVTLNDGNSATLSFDLNATGLVGSTYLVVARGQSNLNSNLNGQSQTKNLEIVDSFGVKLNSISLSQTTRHAGESTQITCQVLNDLTAEPVDNFKVTFSSSRTGTIGTAFTNAAGFTSINYIIPKTPSPNNISETILCLIENDLVKKYYPTIENTLSQQLNVTEFAPWNSGWTITGGTGQDRTRDELVDIQATWRDNFELSHTELEHNGTGSFVKYYQTINTEFNPNLKLYLDFENTSIGTIFDSSNNALNGTLFGGMGTDNLVPKFDNYGIFDGIDDYIEIPYTPQLNSDLFTISTWVNVDSSGSGYRSIMTSRDGFPQRGYMIYVTPSNDYSFWIGDGSAYRSVSGGSITANTWEYITVTSDGSKIQFYKNGILKNERFKKSLLKNTVRSLRIGGGTTEGIMRFPFKGFIDNFQIYNKVLTQSEIDDIYNNDNTKLKNTQVYNLDLTNSSQFPKVGPIYFNTMEGYDNFNWYSKTAPPLYLNLYGYADITQILPTPAAVGNWGESSNIYCEIKDNYTGLPIKNYPVLFNSDISGSLGTINTDTSGRAYISNTITTDTNISCTISDELGLYYYANKRADSVIISIDQIYPTYSNWGFKYSAGGDIADGTHIDNTESVYIHSYWTDNYQLYSGYVTHDGSGTFENYNIDIFPSVLDSPTSWANQTLQFTNSSIFNKVGKIQISGITVSDKANNLNTTTPNKYFYLHGFANATSITIDKTNYGPNTTITINCQITDSTHKEGIENFDVNIISNQTGLISTVQTNALGIATTTYNDTTPGSEIISCNITPTTYYYVDSASTSQEVSFDNIIPYTISNYGVTPNLIHVGESVNIHALWNEQINSSEIYTDIGNFPVLTYQNNWTNGSITADLSWAQGPHNISFINTIDNNLNTNYSTPNLTLDMYHYVDVIDMTLMFSNINVNSGAYFGCKVQDTDLNSEISGYNVSFYENNVFISSAISGIDGWAHSSYIPSSTGVKTIKCNIQRDTTNYYNPVINAKQEKFLTVVALTGRVCANDTLSVPYNNYFDSQLLDGFRLIGTTCATGSNNNFASWITQVTSIADSGSYSRMGSDEKVIHSNGVLDLGPVLRLECSNGKTRDESYTHLYKNIDPASLIGLKVLVYYTDSSGGRGLALDSSPNNVASFTYNSNQNTVNSLSYISQPLTPTTSACTGEDNTGFGATAYYQEIDEYGLIQSMLDEGLSTVDLRMAIYAQSNYDGGFDLASWYYNEIELYTKQLFVSMQTPVSTIESYENKTESITCAVQTSGTNTSNVDLYPQFCQGASCTNFVNIQTNSGLLQVNESSFACTDSSCTKSFIIDTSTEGIYNLRCNSTNFDSYTIPSTSEQLIVYKSDLTITKITHTQNNNSEFEIGDTINQIDVSIQNSIRGKAYLSSATINLINSSGQTPLWSTQFPTIGYCPNPMLQNSTCDLTFKNSEIGYLIDTSAKEGTYNLTTNLLWENSGNFTQSNKSIKIWDLRTRFSSAPDLSTISQGSSTTIRVNFTNPTNNNLTNLQLTMSCPDGFKCNTTNTHPIILPGQTITSNFTISPSFSTPAITHNFTFDVTYNNVRSFSKSWTDITSTSISVTADIFVATLRDYDINKTITSISQNNYYVNLKISNLQNFIQNINLVDFVDSKFTTSNFNLAFNSTKLISGTKYTGTINMWNLTLSNFEKININYILTSNSNNSKLLNNYILGLG